MNEKLEDYLCFCVVAILLTALSISVNLAFVV